MRTVLLHGFTGGAQSFAHLGLDAVTPELPGHGKAAPAVSWEEALRRIGAFLDPAPVILGGYSMGARLALPLALQAPDKIARLVLASGTAGIEAPGERAARRVSDEELAGSIERDGVEKFVARWEANPMVALTPLQAQQLRPQRLGQQAAGLASALRHLGTGAQPSYWEDLKHLRVPVTLLAGERDAKFAAIARRMHALLPNSTLQIVPRCGHVVFVEQPDLFRGALQ